MKTFSKLKKLFLAVIFISIVVFTPLSLIACFETVCKHEFSKWVITTMPTCTAYGIETKMCINIGCNHKITRPRSAIPDNVMLKTGFSHNLAINGQGNLYAWGNNSLGQLGTGSQTARYSSPIRINRLGRMNNARIVYAAADSSVNRSFAIDEFGNLWSWGENDVGELGTGDFAAATQLRIVNIDGRMNNARVRSVFAGSEKAFAIDENGHLWAWGNNALNIMNGNRYLGRLGVDEIVVTNEPVRVSVGEADNKIRTVFIGVMRTFVIDESGSVWVWGSDIYLCDSHPLWGQFIGRPVLLNDDGRLNGNRVVSIISVSLDIALDEYGNVWLWGFGPEPNATGWLIPVVTIVYPVFFMQLFEPLCEFDEWTIIIYPTYEEYGEEARICKLCGNTQTRRISL